MAPQQNVALTLVAAECQGEEQEKNSCLHGQGDVLLETAKRKWGTSQNFGDHVSVILCCDLYTFPCLWHHPAQPAPPRSLVMTTFQVWGQHQVANGSLVFARMKVPLKPMELMILIACKDWSCISGAGGCLGSALQAGKKRLCTRSRVKKQAGQQGKSMCLHE